MFIHLRELELRELTSASYQSMAHVAIYVNLPTRTRALRSSTCTVVRNAFGHLFRAPHYFQTLGYIGFIYCLMIGMGPKIFSVSSPSPWAWLSSLRTWKFIAEVCCCYNIISKWKFLINSILFPRIKSNQQTSHKSSLNNNNRRISQS